MKMKKKIFILTIVLAFFVGVGSCFATMKILSNQGIGSVKITQKEYNNLLELKSKYGKLDELWKEVEFNYYVDINEENLFEGIYKGLFFGLGDNYSSYMTKEEYESWIASTLGEFDGIGITFNQDENGQFIVVSVIENGPADKGGLRPGDIVTKIDDKTYDSSTSIGAAMRGDAGTEVKVTYQRDNEEKTVTLTREHIVQQTVTTSVLEGNIGYIGISGFEEATGEDFLAALDKMEQKSVDGVIIDLRDNGGGLVSSGIEVADALLGTGNITYLENKAGEKEYIESDEKKIDLPYVILVNENTASTSEIVTAAVKDIGQGTIIGTTTFGKGIVQTTTQLEDGSAYQLTVMQYYSPEGKKIHGIGVEPDIPVQDAQGQLEKALELLKK